MPSDLFEARAVFVADDDAVYYVRQLDPSDGVGDFDGLVWYLQHLTGAPRFANVYSGRLKRGARFDARGSRVDCWEGRFVDVPKGRMCGQGELDLCSVTILAPTVAGCDFPEHYLVRESGRGFGGRVWPVPLGWCWERGDPPFPSPAIPPLYAGMLAGDFRADEEIASLGSGPIAPGFARSESLTGFWLGDDGGSYYLTQTPSRRELIWFAEHPTARPWSPTAPATGWANVFFGSTRGEAIEGFWADVPRGASNGAGRLNLRVETPRLLRIERATGGFGGRTLWKVDAADVTVRVESLTVVRGEERRDDPMVYLGFFKVDGATASADDLAGSTATFHAPPEVRLGRDVTGTVAFPADVGTFRTTLSSLRSGGSAGSEGARIGLLAYAIELDSGHSERFRRSRYEAWIRMQEDSVRRTLAAGELPTRENLQARANAVLTQYLGPWEGWPWGDPDDVLGGNVEVVTLRELLERPETVREMRFRGSGAAYVMRVRFTSRTRLNEACSD